MRLDALKIVRIMPAVVWLTVAGAGMALAWPQATKAATRRQGSVLGDQILVTWYGNPHTARMGILGERKGAALAAGLREQAAAYAKVTTKHVTMAYHLVAVIAQGLPGTDGKYRRRESPGVIRAMLDEARANGFKLILDIQPGRSSVAEELPPLQPFLAEPDVYLALDPEFAMSAEQVPGRIIGSMRASEVNAAVGYLDQLITEKHLPPKVLIVHQFTWNMLPDKQEIHTSPAVDVVLDMDGFGDRALKFSTYRSILRQGALPFTGFKLFYKQDTNLLGPAQVLGLVPAPSVVIYQ
jgi:hypothetical protein